MKNRAIFTVGLVLMFGSCPAGAQNFAEILSSVEERNTTLNALRLQTEADRLSARTGLAPSDPGLDLTHQRAMSGGNENKLELNLMQTFDFPSVYCFRLRIAKGESLAADLRYAVKCKEILYAAHCECIDVVYHNALSRELRKCYETADTLYEAVSRKFRAEETSVLEFNKIRLARINAMRAYESNEVELQGHLDELARLNGGVPVSLDTDEFVPVELTEDFDAWFARAKERNPYLMELATLSVIAGDRVKEAGAMWLPKLSIGYRGEKTSGVLLQGIAGGVSIPLWENHGRVKAARAQAEAARAREDAAVREFYNSLKLKYQKLQKMLVIADEYRRRFAEMKSIDYLRAALECGEISLLEYQVEYDYWHDAFFGMMASECEIQKIVTDLNQWADF
ncbi:MAG: TolC family protein [Bacteroidales bacterium]|nr:TolC family protein [Bacteroidales bacterium]